MNVTIKTNEASSSAAAVANKTAGTRTGGNAPPRSGGVMLLKSVSLMLASARRSSQSHKQRNAAADAEKAPRRRRKMDDRTTINPKLLESLAKRTHFNKKELLSLYKIYRKLVSHSNVTSRALANAANPAIAKPYSTIEGIDRNCFRELLHTTFDIVVEEFMMDRIFVGWEKGHDLQPLRLEGFLLGLSTFLRGTLAERTAYCFRVYDMNNDGFITKEEIFTMLRNSMIQQPHEDDPDENIKDLMEFILRKMDIDLDGKISFADFAQTAVDEPMMVEAFGQCLPTAYSVETFMSTLGDVAKS